MTWNCGLYYSLRYCGVPCGREMLCHCGVVILVVYCRLAQNVSDDSDVFVLWHVERSHRRSPYHSIIIVVLCPTFVACVCQSAVNWDRLI